MGGAGGGGGESIRDKQKRKLKTSNVECVQTGLKCQEAGISTHGHGFIHSTGYNTYQDTVDSANYPYDNYTFLLRSHINISSPL